MAYRVTLTQLDVDLPSGERSSSFEVATDIEALRTAQEGVQLAREKGRSVTYEVHDAEGRLVVSYTSAGTKG